jgi:hypothetical protein
MNAKASELYAMMGLTKANAKRRSHAVLWRRHAVRQTLYELGYFMDDIALMERLLFDTGADHSTISNSINQPYHRMIESMKDEAKRYANHYGIPRNPYNQRPDNFDDKIIGVLKGMVGIGGVPSAKEFWAEFEMRAKAALGLLMSPDVRPLSTVELLEVINEAVHWKALNAKDPDPDDFAASAGRFMLRCEQMSEKHWWWCVYDDKEQIDFGNEETREQAMYEAERSYKSRIEKCKNCGRSKSEHGIAQLCPTKFAHYEPENTP